MSGIGNEKQEKQSRMQMLGLGDEVPNFTCKTQVGINSQRQTKSLSSLLHFSITL
tara:strand:+ start:31 stop:195 length:165 start_codon:yes stop_codon:yes gene_type:complete